MNRLRFGLSSALVIAAIAAAQLPARTTASSSTTGGTPQTNPEQTPVSPGFPYRPLPVVHPELMAGRWEAPDPSGTTDSLHIQLSTQSWIYEERLVSVTVDASLRLESLGTISRSLSAQLPGAVEYFRNPTLNTVWVDNHLRLDSAAGIPIELDLAFDEMRMEWRGTVSGGGVSKPVRFLRPGKLLRAPRIAPLVGYWCAEESIGASCVRITEGTDANVHVWQDSASWSGSGQGATGQGRYGRRLRLFEPPAPDAISFTDGPADAKAFYFKGHLSADGTRLEGQLTWPFAGFDSPFAPRPGTFVKSDTGALPDSSRRP